MTTRLPVYMEVTELLNEHPDYIDTICVEDLKPIDQLAEAGKVKLTPVAAMKLKARVKPKPVEEPASSASASANANANANAWLHDQDIEALNKNHMIATTMSTEKLQSILKWSDKHYYDLHLSTDLLTDKVYDYVKRVYGQRMNGTNDKRETMKSVSSETGVGIKPTRGRDAKLPISLRSLDNLYMGEADVEKWAINQPGPYHLSAKMDGTSALYSGGVLYTRGDATIGRNISHVIPYLKLPVVPYAVRGEIVIDNAVFNKKYKDKPSRIGGQVRKNNRNSVAGALGSINNIDEGFLADLSFLAYEIITDCEREQSRPSEQFQLLMDAGFQVAYHETTPVVTDRILSDLYHRLIKTYNFEVDGVVIRTDIPYVRENDKNPNYAKAYKEALDNDVAVTRVIAMEWNVSQYGYLVPTVIYEPVNIGGVTLQRATGHNAREVQKLGLGTGALIEVVYRAKVNPQVNRVIEPVEPEMPTIPYVWVNGNGSSDAVNIAFKPSLETSVTLIQINVKRVHKFLTEIGAKGIGETTVEKIFTTSGYKTVGDFINIKISDVTFLGKQVSQNIVTAIKEAMDKVDLPTLMASSKVFGRGLGTKKFVKVFKQFPKFAETRYTYQEYVQLFKQVEGFADKTSTLAAQGMVDFWEFVDSQLSADIYKRIIENTGDMEDEPEPAPTDNDNGKALSLKNIYLTGTRDQDVIALIKKHGGVMQSGFTSNTDILVKKSHDYNNNKTEEAATRGIMVYTVDEFKLKFKG